MPNGQNSESVVALLLIKVVDLFFFPSFKRYNLHFIYFVPQLYPLCRGGEESIMQQKLAMRHYDTVKVVRRGEPQWLTPI